MEKSELKIERKGLKMNKYFNVKNIFIAICAIIVLIVAVIVLKGCGTN